MVMGEATLETDLAVIGGGPGGYAAAFRAADLGLDVALIELSGRLGGVCLFMGCIPAKAVLEMSEFVHEARQAEEWGIKFGEPQLDLNAMRQWKTGVIKRLGEGLMNLAERREVQVIKARATFESSDHLRLQGAEVAHVKFKHAILATGSHFVPLPGMESQPRGRVMDAAMAMNLLEIPQRLLVVGGGYIGLELGSAYAFLGSKVTLIEDTGELMPGWDRDLMRPLERKVEQLFEAVHVNTRVAQMDEGDEQVKVTLEGEGLEQPEQTFDRVLVAIGRRPNSEGLGLENTRIELDDRGYVVVDEQQRTADEHIFAVGDVAGEPMLAHKAMREGKVAAEVIAGEPAAFDARCIPQVLYTRPQVGWCGLMEEEARQRGLPVKTARFPWTASGRALTLGLEQGMTKLVVNTETERVLGVGIAGVGAENLIGEGALAVEMGALAEDVALTIHPHPTLTETEEEAAEAFLGHATHIFPRRK